MDLTQIFKANTMAIKVQRKKDFPVDVLDKNRILPKKSKAHIPNDEFEKEAKDVCEKITSLRNVLLENRSSYMRIGEYLKSFVHMTDEQRDLIDCESEKFVTFYTQYLAQLRTQWKSIKRKPQHKEHIAVVCDILEAYLRSVQKMYLDQKQYRIQYELETYRFLKLAADKSIIPVRHGGSYLNKSKQRLSSTSSNDSKEHGDGVKVNGYNSNDGNYSEFDLRDGWEIESDIMSAETSETQSIISKEHQNNTNSNIKQICDEQKLQTHSSQQVAINEDIEKSMNDEGDLRQLGISPEDIQMFEKENVQLYNQLQGLSEEVEQIEKNVVDIARLQDIFTEKVTMQQHNIDRIANAVIGATENVKDANEQIKQAIQRNAGLRVWSLFFLLVMSFALLFLDWYYD